MQLKSLRIINIQSHEDTFIDFTNGLNIIVGESNHGKTAIYRAAKWLYLNEYDGNQETFIRKNKSYAEVIATLDSGYIIGRVQGTHPVKGKVNEYYVVNPSNERTTYSSVSTSVPDAVWELLGIGHYTMPGEKKPAAVNFSDQDDPPFLLKESGPNKARILNSFTGVDKLDVAIRGLTTDSRDFSKQMKHLKDQSNSLNEEIKTYDSLEEYEDSLIKLSHLSEKADTDLKFIETLTTWLSVCKSLTTRASKSKRALDELAIYDKSCEVLSAIDAQILEFDKLQELHKFVQRVNAQMNVASNVINGLPEEASPCILQEKLDELEALKTHLNALQAQVAKIKDLSFKIKGYEKSIPDFEKDYTNLLVKSGTCPTCNTKITPECVEHAND